MTLPSAPGEEVLDAEPVESSPPSSDMGIEPDPYAPAPQASAGPGKFYPPPPLPVDPYDIPLAPEAPPPLPAGTPQGPPRRPCPMCGEMIPVNAVQCRFCHEIFDPSLKKAQGKKYTADTDENMSTGEWVVAILCSGIGCICGIIWMIQGKPKGKKMLGVSLLFAVLWSVIRGILESQN
jgi:hypothetical protein